MPGTHPHHVRLPHPAHFVRTGDEPVTARSPLRLRLGLALFGLLWTAVGTVAFLFAHRPGWALACGVLWLVTTVDVFLILRHIRQGPHYQPGRDVPPYRRAR